MAHDPELEYSQDARYRHVEQYAYKPRDPVVNAPLIEHMSEEHPVTYAAWIANKTVGDLEDEHYRRHGLLVTDTEIVAALAEGRGSQ